MLTTRASPRGCSIALGWNLVFQSSTYLGDRFHRRPEVSTQPLESDGSTTVASQHWRFTDPCGAFQRVWSDSGRDWCRSGSAPGKGSSHCCWLRPRAEFRGPRGGYYSTRRSGPQRSVDLTVAPLGTVAISLYLPD